MCFQFSSNDSPVAKKMPVHDMRDRNYPEFYNCQPKTLAFLRSFETYTDRLTMPFAYWLVNMDPSVLDGYAVDIYKAVVRAGDLAIIPADHLVRVLTADFASIEYIYL